MKKRKINLFSDTVKKYIVEYDSKSIILGSDREMAYDFKNWFEMRFAQFLVNWKFGYKVRPAYLESWEVNMIDDMGKLM